MDLQESEDSMVYVVSSRLPGATIFLKTLFSRVQKSYFNISASLSLLRLFPVVMEASSVQAWSWVLPSCENKVP